MNKSFALSIESPAAEAVGAATTVDGMPVQRFLKKVIPVGKFVKHDQKTKAKLWELDVTPDRQKLWVDTFKTMKAGGVPVRISDETGNFTIDAPNAKVTKNHAGAWDKPTTRLKKLAENVVAETQDLFIADDGWVTAVVEAKGQPAIDFLKTAQFTSPEIDPCFIDGTDKRHGEAITAISIVANPLVPGQTGFETIAASADSPERFVLSLDNGEPEMKTLLAMIATFAAMPIDSLTTEQQGVDALKAIQAKHAETEGKLTKALSSDQPDKVALGLAAKYAGKEIDNGLKGVLTEAGIKAVKETLIGDPAKGQYAPWILSHDEPDAAVNAAEELCKVIKDNRVAITPGAKTALQNTKVLSSEEPNGQPKEITPERLKELLSHTVTGREILTAHAGGK